MRWQIRSEQELYRDRWIDVRIADVELPDGRHLDHRLIRTLPGAGAVVLNPHNEVLLLWRHRFITDVWNYEIPMGGLEPGEDPIVAAAREVEEETGWRVGPLRPLLYDEPMNGLVDTRNHIFITDVAEFIGPPHEGIESDRVAWIPLAKIVDLIGSGQIVGGTTIAALLMAARERAQ
jgi:8-oxo-dGTP pyrophosphatase MutT (NUDIX family)